MAKRLPAMYIADVHLHNWSGYSCHCITQCDRCMGERTRIQHNSINSKPRFVDFVQNRSFVVALKIFQFHIWEYTL